MTTKWDITINKDCTPISKATEAKERIKDFKGLYTIPDVLRMYEEVTGNDTYGEPILLHAGISYNGEYYEYQWFICAEFLIYNYATIKRLRFYIDLKNDGMIRIQDDPNGVLNTYNTYSLDK